jgi:choline dehydrogenase-like flavoprotein
MTSSTGGNTVLTVQEKRMRTYLSVLLAVTLAGLALCGVWCASPHGAEPPLTPVVMTGVSVLLILQLLMCWYAIADLRRSTLLVKLLLWISLLAAAGGAGLLLDTDPEGTIRLTGLAVRWETCLAVFALVHLANAVCISFLFASAERARYGLKYFSPVQFRTIAALAEVVIYGEHKLLSGNEVAQNVDRYFNSFEAKTKWTMAWVVTGLYFFPILSLLPPLPYLSPARRHDFLKRRFYRDVESRRMPEFWRVLVQGMIRIAKQMCYIGYYSDKRTFAAVGYVPFSERPDAQARLQQARAKKRQPLQVRSANDVAGSSAEGDVIIIGSGAAASILAKGLVESGRKVVMIERGNYERPETFNEDEMDMVSRLFQDGAIQAARDFRFTVFQGSCVGGSTVVNNAVCFTMPPEVLDLWNDPRGVNAGLDARGVMASMDRAWEMIGVEHMDEKEVRLNPGGALFRKGCAVLGLNTPPTLVDSVNANISGCAGCGYCNIGCKYDRKLSMLHSILPGIQSRFGAESLDIIAGCEAVKVVRTGNRISAVECEFRDGRKIAVRGTTFVVSAGAVSSSILLLKSKLGIRNAGKHLSFNVGSQLTAAFPQKIDSYDGLQISHFLKIAPNPGYVMESWFNPPMFQSTAMPGWFEDHFHNMRRYDRLACVGILVGSESNAEARVGGLTRREIRYTPTSKDFKTLLAGLELSGEIMFAAGAESVMPNTFKYYEFKNVAALRRLSDVIKDPSEITLGTGHPQGGNVIGSSSVTGVVNAEFKVFDYQNLYVCDASVFPTSLGVNPQLTVMGLADYAVQFVKENRG